MPKDNDEPTAEDLMGLGSDDVPQPPAADLASAIENEEGRLHPILSNAEFRAAEKKALDRILKEDKTAAAKQVEDEMVEKVRGKKGLVTGNPILDELVDITLDLAEYADHIKINGTIYMHGGTYTVPRHVANTLREMQSRGHDHQTELDGKGRAEKMRKPHNTVIDKNGVHNAPQSMGA